MRLTRPTLLLLATAVALAGCPSPGGLKPPAKPPSEPKASARPAIAGATRLVPQAGVPARLTGQIRLRADVGSGVISNNSGNVLSNQGGMAISDNGAGAISDNGAGYRLAQGPAAAAATRDGGPPAEARLAEATIEAVDAVGRVLVDEGGKPLTATSGRDGAFSFAHVLPAEAVVLRVRLAKAGRLKGGELRALLAKDAPRQATLDLDTAASVGASFVLETYVAANASPQTVLDKLPAREAGLLRAAVGQALAGAAAPPSYEPTAQAALAADLRGRDAGLDARLDAIEAILLAGQANLGSGLAATRVAIVEPISLNPDGRGGLLVGEAGTGRVRRIDADGTMGLYVDGEVGEHKLDFSRAASHRVGPDGSLYVCEVLENRIRRLKPDGTLETVAQNARTGSGLVAGAKPDFAPRSLAFGPAGELYVGEEERGEPAQLTQLFPDGRRVSLGRPPGDLHDWSMCSLDVAATGRSSRWSRRCSCSPPTARSSAAGPRTGPGRSSRATCWPRGAAASWPCPMAACWWPRTAPSASCVSTRPARARRSRAAARPATAARPRRPGCRRPARCTGRRTARSTSPSRARGWCGRSPPTARSAPWRASPA